MRKIDKVAGILGDVGIPFMGVLCWGWSFYFILLYSIADLLIRQIFINERLKLTLLDNQKKRHFFQKNLVLLIVELAIVHVLVKLLNPKIDFTEETWRFWAYKDMGIQQGPILIPAVFLMEYLRIRNEKKLGFTGSFQIEVIREQYKMGIYRLLFYLASLIVVYTIHLKENYIVYGFLTYLTIIYFIPLKNQGKTNV